MEVSQDRQLVGHLAVFGRIPQMLLIRVQMVLRLLAKLFLFIYKGNTS